MQKSKGNASVALIAVVCILVVGVLAFVFTRTSAPEPTTVEVPTTQEQPDAGAIAGDRVDGKFFTVGGVTEYRTSMIMRKATTTPCALQSPNATTTMSATSYTSQFDVSSTSAMLVEQGTATTAFATTTLIGRNSLAANARLSLVGSTTPTTFVIAPNTWFVTKVAPTSPGTISPTGTCALNLFLLN